MPYLHLLNTVGSALKKYSRKTIGIIIISLTIGAVIGGFITRIFLLKQEGNLLAQIRPLRQNNPNFHFTNPLIGYNIPNANEFTPFDPLQNKLTNFISTQTGDGKTTDASVYFRDLNLGKWVGINENAQYDPASMLKVVIMLAYYKKSEGNHDLLLNKIIYTKLLDNSLDEIPYQTPSILQVGKAYTLEQLIETMIINSDNGAKNSLLNNIDETTLDQVYTDLGIQAPQDNKNYIISAKSYSLFLRTLYNSTYLDENLSEKALSLLSRATYKDGLVAGLPPSIQAAQKFGEHVTTDSSGQVLNIELNNCGVIYHPQRPYILCVMTRGSDLGTLTGVIKNISNLVYQSVDSNYQQ